MPLIFDKEMARSLEQSYGTPEIAMQRQYTLNALQLQPRKFAIDIGCGPGFLVEDIARVVGRRGRAIGLDNSSPMLAHEPTL